MARPRPLPASRGSEGPLYLFGTAVLWSFIGVLVRGNTQSPFLIGGVTAVVTAMFLLLVSRPRIVINKTVVLAGVAAFVTNCTFTFANQLTSVGNAIVLQYTSMIFVIVYQAIAERRLPAGYKVLSVAFAFMGMVLFFFDELSPAGMLGNILAIVSGAAFGLCFFLNTRRDAAPLVSSLLSNVCSLVPFLFYVGQLPSVMPLEWAFMLAQGLLCSGLASLLYARGIVKTPAFMANLVCMSEVIMAPLWSYLLFGEVFGRMAFAGAAIIVSVIVVNLWLDMKSRLRREQPESIDEALDETRSQR